jgi:hypothetical protein
MRGNSGQLHAIIGDLCPNSFFRAGRAYGFREQLQEVIASIARSGGFT